MKLSELNSTPRYPVVIPSTNKKTTYRPFLVREEKALLTAQESEDIQTMIATMDNVVRNCLANPPDRLTTFDLEYLMTLIRAKSVGEHSDLIFSCDKCNDPNAKAQVSIDLTKVKEPETINNFIRAMQPWPGAWTRVKILSDKDIKILRLKLLESHIENGKLVLDEVQLEGKNPVRWKQFEESYKNIKFC